MLSIHTDQKVEDTFNAYPECVKSHMLELRKLVIEAAEEMPEINQLEETLKWGEPSFLTKHGSTVRMDWKSKAPHQYAIYFKCTSRLVETFKVVFKETFKYEGTRAIVFQMEDVVPKNELKKCIKAALYYHKVKHLPDLGI